MARPRPPATKAELDAVLATANNPAVDEPDEQPRRGLGGEVWARTRSIRHRLRRQLYPHYVAVGLLAVAIVVEALRFTSGGGYRVTAALAVATVCAMTATLLGISSWLRLRLECKVPARYRGWAIVCGVVAAVWLTLASYRLTWTTVALLLAGEYVLAAGWWRHVRITGPDVEDEAPAQAELDEPDLTFVEDYDANVGGRDRQIPGSYVFDSSVQANGVMAYEIQGVKGKHTLSTYLTALPYIASGTDTPIESLVPEAHPSGKPSQVVIKVVERSPLHGDVLFDGPRFADGIVEIGPYADLDGDAPYRLYTPGDSELDGSMWSGFWVGDSGIGKSHGVENIATSIMSAWRTHPTVVIYCDPQNGGSSPALQAHADYYVPLDGFGTLLSGLENLAHWRGLENSEQGRTGFRPVPCTCPVPATAVVSGVHEPDCRYRPGIWVVIEECHMPFGHADFAERTGTLARTVRKLGMGFLLLSQYSGVATFGGSEPLRSSTMAGNVIVMHTSSRLGGMLIPGLEVDPLTLPKYPQGFGYTTRTGPFGRTAPFRNRLIREADKLMSAYPRLSLDPLARNAFDQATDGAYSARHASVEQIRSANSRLVAAMREGRFDDIDRLARDASTSASPPKFEVVHFDAWPHEGADDLPAPAPARTSDAGEPDANSRVLAAVQSGLETPAEIAAATGYTDRSVHRALNYLTATGDVAKAARGRYITGDQTDLEEPADSVGSSELTA